MRAIMLLVPVLLITSCGTVNSSAPDSAQRLLCPDVIEYSLEDQIELADEIKSLKQAPKFIADYHVMRNQSRICLK